MVAASVMVLADTVGPIDFESYSLGSVNGQDGWVSLGSVGSGCAVYDHAVAFNSSAPPSFASQSLRISNAVTSGCFGDQTFSKPLVNEAGESAASNASLSGGVRQPHFDVQFDIASKVPSSVQPGLLFSTSPDRGDGARMSYLRVEDNLLGIDVFFDDVQQPTPCVPAGCANFVETQVATALDRTRAHTLGLSIDFYNGPSNDVVRVYVDGVLVHTGTTWEDYFRYDPESYDGSPSRTVDSMIFRSGGTAVLANFGNGFLIDNLKLNSGAILVGPPTNKDQCKNGGWQTFNNPSFKNQGQCIQYVNTGK